LDGVRTTHAEAGGGFQTHVHLSAADELLRVDEPLGARLRRRARVIAIEVVMFVLVTALFVPLALLAAVVELVRWLRRRDRWVAVRLLAMAWWFLLIELLGLLGLLRLWVVSAGKDPRRFGGRLHRLLHWWLRSHFRGVRAIFGLRFEVEGLECAGPGPVVILMRHGSTVDTLLPEGVIAEAHALRIRYVLKRELLALPTIDIGRRWWPTVFVRRGSGAIDAELEQVSKLAVGLDTNEAALIYPEGTLYTPEKLARAQEIIGERQPELSDAANRLRHVLPPRPGGTRALLQAAGDVDVVLCGHTGLVPFRSLRDLRSDQLVGSTVRVKFWRHAGADIPVDSEDAFTGWLYERWFELDDWIGGAR
jgi:1-acyl-sn-glycerol-3-phosphate acyltransferase